MSLPQTDPELIDKQLANLSRSPFATQAARFLKCAPSDGAIVALAEKNPDRWAQSLAIVARLAGYNEKLQLEGTLTHRIDALSDAQLEAEIALLTTSFDCQSNVIPPKLLEHKPLGD